MPFHHVIQEKCVAKEKFGLLRRNCKPLYGNNNALARCTGNQKTTPNVRIALIHYDTSHTPTSTNCGFSRYSIFLYLTNHKTQIRSVKFSSTSQRLSIAQKIGRGIRLRTNTMSVLNLSRFLHFLFSSRRQNQSHLHLGR